MKISSQQQSARIYQFPVRFRKSSGGDAPAEQVGAPDAIVAVETGSAWYHEAALQEDRRKRNG